MRTAIQRTQKSRIHDSAFLLILMPFKNQSDTETFIHSRLLNHQHVCCSGIDIPAPFTHGTLLFNFNVANGIRA